MMRALACIALLALATPALAHRPSDPWPPMTTTTTPCSAVTTTTLPKVCVPGDDVGVCADPCPAAAPAATFGISCHQRADGSLRCPRKGAAHRILLLNTDPRFPQD